jgi:hypothetical protein
LGTNKRNAGSIDRRMRVRVNESIMRGAQPESLSNAELELNLEPLTRTPIPRPVRAWVRYGNIPIQVDAVVTAWTTRAVAIKWESPDGEHKAWVWSNAVVERP